MSYEFYKLIHFLGIFMLFVSLGGAILFVINNGERESNVWRKQVAITHGVGIFLVLLGGFGMLAKLGINWPWPGWIIAKFMIWLLLGGALTLIYKKPELSKVLWTLILVLGFGAAYFAGMKPF
jgi:hypothetical protein